MGETIAKLLALGAVAYFGWQFLSPPSPSGGAAAGAPGGASVDSLAAAIQARAIRAGYGSAQNPPLMTCDQWGVFLADEQGHPAPDPESIQCFPEGRRDYQLTAKGYVEKLLRRAA
jgi:hypothetical protein